MKANGIMMSSTAKEKYTMITGNSLKEMLIIHLSKMSSFTGSNTMVEHIII